MRVWPFPAETAAEGGLGPAKLAGGDLDGPVGDARARHRGAEAAGLGAGPAPGEHPFPDVRRELLKVHDQGQDLVVVQLLIQGTFLGPYPTPAGPLAPNGKKTSVPTADFFYLRDGKIQTFDCYPMLNIRLAQIGVSFDFASAVKQPAGPRADGLSSR